MLKFLKGILIGISNVIPGLCSATVSLMLRMYDELLDSISNVFNIKKWKQYGYLYISIITGIIIGIIVLNSLYKFIPFILNMIFLGLLLRTFPVKISEYDLKVNKIIFLLGIMIVVGLGLCNNNIISINYNTLNVVTISFIILNGLISSVAMILPGISGALLLVVTGIYFPLLSNIENIILSIISFDKISVYSILFILIFSVSFIIGLISSSKAIKYVLNKYQSFSYNIINGMIIGSIINLTLNCYDLFYSLIEVVIGIIILIIVYLLPKKKK